MGNTTCNLHKLNMNFDIRYVEYKRITSKYPNKIPVILHKYINNNDITNKDLDNNNNTNIYIRLMVDNKINIQNIINIVKLKFYNVIYNDNIYNDSIYIYTIHNNNFIFLSPNDNIKILYDKYKDEDGFIYLFFSKENVFG
jgi:hypothetical protein